LATGANGALAAAEPITAQDIAGERNIDRIVRSIKTNDEGACKGFVARLTAASTRPVSIYPKFLNYINTDLLSQTGPVEALCQADIHPGSIATEMRCLS
jgi:hypothetical protein